MRVVNKGVASASDLRGRSRKVRRLEVLDGGELVDLERGRLNALPDHMGVGSGEMPIGEECGRRWSGFVKPPDASGS